MVEVTGPRFAAVSFDELAMLLGLHDRFERHFNRLGSAFRSQNFLGSPHQPIVEPQRRQYLCHNSPFRSQYIQIIKLKKTESPDLFRSQGFQMKSGDVLLSHSRAVLNYEC